MLNFKIVSGLTFLMLPNLASAACDCGSINQASPCVGQSISVTVPGGAAAGVYNWSFNSGGGDARCGQFANGDYWVVPAFGQSSVTVTSITSTSPGTLKADVDPVMESQGLLGEVGVSYGNYNNAENIIPSLPMSFTGINSIVAGLRKNTTVEGNCGTAGLKTVGCMSSYNIVTVLPTVPVGAGSTVIRPNITGSSVKETLTLSDFDFTRIPSVSYLNGTTASGMENIRKRWSHSTEIFSLYDGVASAVYSEGGRGFRASAVISDYGAAVAQQWSDDLMVLFSSTHAFDDKKAALAAMISYGLDIYHGIYDPPNGRVRYWGTGATQHSGKFLPPVLMAALSTRTTDDNDLREASSHIYDGPGRGPLELAQVRQGKNGLVWGDNPYESAAYLQHGNYWSGLFRSQCYDTGQALLMYDYYTPGEWKSFNIPIGSKLTGSGLKFTLFAGPNGSLGNLKIKNVELDGVPIIFNASTLTNYHNATVTGTVELSGLQYTVGNGQRVMKQTAETYTLTSESVLTFDWYQDNVGASYGIGFDENAVFDATKRILQISGSYSQNYMFQDGCNSDIDSKTQMDVHGYIDGPNTNPGSFYIGSSLSNQKSMVAAMILMPEIRSIVNFEDLIKYVFRAVNEGTKTAGDPCVTPDSREIHGVCNAYTNTNCTYYGVTWGPENINDYNSDCIKTPTPPYTKVGRYLRKDGAVISQEFMSNQVEANWDTITSGFVSCETDEGYCTTELECADKWPTYNWCDATNKCQEAECDAPATCATDPAECDDTNCFSTWGASDYDWCEELGICQHQSVICQYTSNCSADSSLCDAEGCAENWPEYIWYNDQCIISATNTTKGIGIKINNEHMRFP